MHFILHEPDWKWHCRAIMVRAVCVQYNETMSVGISFSIFFLIGGSMHFISHNCVRKWQCQATMMHIVYFRGLGPFTLPIQGIRSRQMRNVRRAYPKIGSPPSLKKACPETIGMTKTCSTPPSATGNVSSPCCKSDSWRSILFKSWNRKSILLTRPKFCPPH